MSYLDWKGASPFSLHHQPKSPAQSVLTLSLGTPLLAELASSLEDIYAPGGTELRIALPEQWLLFWKIRDQGNRLLLAHPNEKEWVVTCALEKVFAEDLVLSLKNLAQGQSLSLSQMDSVSNLELILVHQGSG